MLTHIAVCTQLWDMATRLCAQVLIGHVGPVISLGYDGCYELFEAASPRCWSYVCSSVYGCRVVSVQVMNAHDLQVGEGHSRVC